MSLGGPTSSAIDTAVQNSIAAGVTYVVAAGNNNSNACNYSPARVGAALTVGATGSSDGRASFSNFGSCLDLFAPGVGVLSSIHTSNSASATSSGTSMAAPHVAGAAAIYLQSAPAATPAQVANSILSNATPNVVGTPGTGSPNRLLYVQSTSTTVCSPEYPHLPVVLGTEGDDPNLRGTAQSERICGLNGNDTIYGDQGNDVINGNQGTDTIYGDVGDDLLRGGRDNDTLYGGDGSDTIYGDLGDDVVQGNIGNDTVAGGDGNDTIRGGQNDDTVMGDAGNDLLYGDLGNDILWGGAGADFFEYYSGNGNDLIQDFQWSVDRLRLYNVTISSYTQLGADCQVNLSTGATIRLVNVGTCRNPQ
jgi:Ca2+-binding RTX toxin-like protein